jgi:uncharacterized protein (TIGR04255 family)
MTKFPTSLKEAPVVESVIEVRFEPKSTDMAGILPGVFFQALSSSFPAVRALPMAQLPVEMRNQDENLRYAATTVLVGNAGQILLGDRSCAISFVRPYPGWSVALPHIKKVLEVLKESNCVANIERISIKYVNVMSKDNEQGDFSPFEVKLVIGSFQLRNEGKMIRAEIAKGQNIFLINMLSGATAKLQGNGGEEEIKGSILQIDGVRNGPFEDFWSAAEEIIEDIHRGIKEVFFGVITKKTLEQLEPVWEI